MCKSKNFWPPSSGRETTAVFIHLTGTTGHHRPQAFWIILGPKVVNFGWQVNLWSCENPSSWNSHLFFEQFFLGFAFQTPDNFNKQHNPKWWFTEIRVTLRNPKKRTLNHLMPVAAQRVFFFVFFRSRAAFCRIEVTYCEETTLMITPWRDG